MRTSIQHGKIYLPALDTITATVTEGKKVIYQNKVMSLSAAALKAVQSLGYKTLVASGFGYWKFDGELLAERRQRIETGQFDETSANDV